MDKTYHGIDPSTGKALWEVPVATRKDLDDAVVAANSAFKEWSGMQHSERRQLLNEFADGLETYKKELTELVFKESGKPVRFA